MVGLNGAAFADPSVLGRWPAPGRGETVLPRHWTLPFYAIDRDG